MIKYCYQDDVVSGVIKSIYQDTAVNNLIKYRYQDGVVIKCRIRMVQ